MCHLGNYGKAIPVSGGMEKGSEAVSNGGMKE